METDCRPKHSLGSEHVLHVPGWLFCFKILAKLFKNIFNIFISAKEHHMISCFPHFLILFLQHNIFYRCFGNFTLSTPSHSLPSPSSSPPTLMTPPKCFLKMFSLCDLYTQWSMVQLSVACLLSRTESFSPTPLPDAINCGELHLTILIVSNVWFVLLLKSVLWQLQRYDTFWLFSFCSLLSV